MILIVIIFIIQFSVSIATLVVDTRTVAADGWCALDDVDRINIQFQMHCYGFQDASQSHFNASMPDFCMRPGSHCPGTCTAPDCPDGPGPACSTCYDLLKDQMSTVLNRAGGVGLALSFFEVRHTAIRSHS